MVKLQWLQVNKFRSVKPGTRLTFNGGHNVLLGQLSLGGQAIARAPLAALDLVEKALVQLVGQAHARHCTKPDQFIEPIGPKGIPLVDSSSGALPLPFWYQMVFIGILN